MNNMNILLLPKYHPEGASSRYRLYNYIQYFEGKGHRVDVKPLLYKGYVKDLYSKNRNKSLKIMMDIFKRLSFLIKNRKNYDVLIIEKELFTNIPFFIEWIILKGTTYTVDYDDAISINYKRNRVKRLLFRNKIDKLTAGAAVTTVGNRWYWNELKKASLEYLPTVVDLKSYNYKELTKTQNLTPIIVWIGSPSTVHYLKCVETAIKVLAQKHDFILRVIGANIELDGVKVQCFKWSQEMEFKLLYEADIGIMPLFDTIWEKGKCGFKLIQYMASSLPTVASSAPANEEITLQGKTGFIASHEEDWVNYLSKLIEDKELRAKMGVAARKRIEENYSYQIWGDRFVEIIEKLN
ncbi:MAG: glycosyltransferase family 4 protein [Bacillota bacterium]|nr:glycosyltransferase family 4 protein [Bacillota bacterium]